MSHCYSVTVNVNGEDKEICTSVPGNEDLSRQVEAGGNPTPSNEHISRAIDYYLQHTHEEDEKIKTNPSGHAHPRRGSIIHK